MKLLELFSGQGTISKTFQANGFQTFKVDWSKEVQADLYADIATLTIEDILKLCNGLPDVIWASPQCTTYSIATHIHRTLKENLVPKTPLALQDDLVNVAMWDLIDELIAAGTKYYFVENPRARMRHMSFTANRPRYTITYCSYGHKGNSSGFEELYTMKPTDIWTNHPNPNFKNVCTQKNPPHKHGNLKISMKRDYLSRGEMPEKLRQHLVNICVS